MSPVYFELEAHHPAPAQPAAPQPAAPAAPKVRHGCLNYKQKTSNLLLRLN